MNNKKILIIGIILGIITTMTIQTVNASSDVFKYFEFGVENGYSVRKLYREVHKFQDGNTVCYAVYETGISCVRIKN